MRKLAILGVGVLAVVAGILSWQSPSGAQQQRAAQPDSVLAPQLAAADTAGLAGPRQPIFFRHDIHAGQFKMQCQYCHYSVDVSPEPGIPSVQTCMGCHLVISGSDSGGRTEIRKLRQAWNEKKPVEWVRIHSVSRHAHFPHMRHIRAMGPNACGTCHGDVARMPQVYAANNINKMGFCISCHLERQVTRDCSTCHY